MGSLWTDSLHLAKAWSWMITQPGFALIMALPIMHVLSLLHKEDKLYGVRIEAPTPLVLRMWLLGIITGILCTGIFATWTWNVHLSEVYLIWGMTFLFSLFGIRFACIAYSVGILSVCSLLVNQIGSVPLTAPWGQWWEILHRFSMEEWLILVGLLHIMEGILIRLDGASGIHPVQTKHRDGKQVNGFLLAKGWPVPLMLTSQVGWLPLPVFLSYSLVNLSKSNERQRRLASTLTILYGFSVLLVLYFLSEQVIGKWLSTLWVIGGHEGIYQWSRWNEHRKEPMYVSDTNGIRVLAVHPNSPAQVMGIRTGDIIQRINGVVIQSMQDIEEATQRSATCKCEVLDRNMNRHMMQKALYENDPRNLGVVGATMIDPPDFQSKRAMQTN
ncbi:PDZ domain-containing protein [Hazenella coriacea]|uniref:PDZ domain-containing protein n=1 Tax=Hazenella coriacea TaxID=1179467 RepID=A0A4R3LBJ1_9BACL|nr:PDZ domain-containing protein [Hazenella coriacea]TCS95674.1 PDZ domain-containing protein [Hazenella coriacea]